MVNDDQKQEDYYKNVRTNVSFPFFFFGNLKRKILMLRPGVAGLDNDQRGFGGCDLVGTLLGNKQTLTAVSGKLAVVIVQ